MINKIYAGLIELMDSPYVINVYDYTDSRTEQRHLATINNSKCTLHAYPFEWESRDILKKYEPSFVEFVKVLDSRCAKSASLMSSLTSTFQW